MHEKNVGYLKLDFFPDASVCGASAKAAMASLNNADALIFDLRDNAGGFENMVSLIASYLFNHPEYMYSPRGAPTEDSWTRSPVPGNRLADKPVYILTSSTTWSGAEQFSYDLKMLKRATLVGETTRGALMPVHFTVSTSTSAWAFPKRRRSTLLERPMGKGSACGRT